MGLANVVGPVYDTVFEWKQTEFSLGGYDWKSDELTFVDGSHERYIATEVDGVSFGYFASLPKENRNQYADLVQDIINTTSIISLSEDLDNSTMLADEPVQVETKAVDNSESAYMCEQKVDLFREIAIAEGYGKDIVDKYVVLGKYKCQNPSYIIPSRSNTYNESGDMWDSYNKSEIERRLNNIENNQNQYEYEKKAEKLQDSFDQAEQDRKERWEEYEQNQKELQDTYDQIEQNRQDWSKYFNYEF